MHLASKYVQGHLQPIDLERAVQYFQQYCVDADCVGFYSVSWLWDKNLSEISPGLDFLRRIAQDTGALIIQGVKLIPGKITPNEADALKTSEARRQAWMSGTYHPRLACAVWRRSNW